MNGIRIPGSGDAMDFSGFWSDRHKEQRAQETANSSRQTDLQLEKLRLICMAMWSLIKEKTNLTEDDLLKRVQEIDLKDGVADGKLQQPVGECPNCHRTLSLRHHRCLYCGYEQQTDFAAFNYAPPPPGEQFQP